MKRAKFVAGATALACVVALSACAPVSSGNSDNGGKTTLTVWGWNTDSATQFQQVFDMYTAKHPNVTIKYVPYKASEYDTILKTGLSGNSGPDVPMLRSYGGIQSLVDSKDLVDLSGKVDALSNFPKGVLAGAQGADGKEYGVPFAIQTLHILYNNDIFKKNNLQVPKTWDDMVTVAKTLKAAGITPFASVVADNWMLPVEHEIFGATRYGGEGFEGKVVSGQAKFTDPDWVASVDAWTSLKDYWEPGYTGVGYDEAKSLFVAGKAAMYPGGIYEVAGFRQLAPNMDLGIFSAPPAPGATISTPLTPGYVDGSFGVSAKSKHQEAATAFVNWLATPEFGQAYSEVLHQISPIPGVQIKDPLLKQAAADYAAHPSPYITYADFNYGDPTGWSVSCSALQKVVLGQQTAAQAAADLQKAVDQAKKN